jgi:hypothetical protein
MQRAKKAFRSLLVALAGKALKGFNDGSIVDWERPSPRPSARLREFWGELNCAAPGWPTSAMSSGVNHSKIWGGTQQTDKYRYVPTRYARRSFRAHPPPQNAREIFELSETYRKEMQNMLKLKASIDFLNKVAEI